MNKKTLLAGLVFAGLLAAAAIITRTPEKGTRTADSPRPLPKLGADAFDTLVFSKGDHSTTIKRVNGGYRVVAPVDFAADPDAAKDAFEAIESLSFGSIVTDQKSKHAELEVSETAGRVVAKKGDTVVADLRIGKTIGNQTLLRLEGKDEVWQAQGLLQYKLDKEPGAWRDKTVVKFDEDKATRLEVSARDGSRVVFEKTAPAKPAGGEDSPAAGGEADWVLKDASLKIDNLDKSVVTGMVSALYAFRANDFADDVSPADAGLAPPALTVTVGVGDSEKYTVHVGKKRGEDDYFVRKEGSPQIYVVKKWSLERVNRRPIEFRDKQICNLSEGELAEVSVARKDDAFTLVRTGDGSEAWKLSKPKAELDTSKMASLLGVFSQWKAQGMAEDTSPGATGLGKPTAIITARSKLKGGCTLKVGALTSDNQSYHVEASSRPEVFLVQKWSLDRVLVKVDDLKKK